MKNRNAILCLSLMQLTAGSALAEPVSSALNLSSQTSLDAYTSRNPHPESTHISIVLVGDTGYAPSRVKPRENGVAKHGRWQTWQQTTKDIDAHINGDINFANMESVVSSNTRLRPNAKKFNFMTHPNGVKHLVSVGFNLFAMANNHAYDFGAQGIRDSVSHMDAFTKDKGVVHAGIGLSRNAAANAVTFERNGSRFAFGAIGIGASGSGRATDKKPGQLNIHNRSDSNLLMRNLRETKADYRMVSVHRGTERKVRTGNHEISDVRRMIRDGNADLVIGHHAHVVRGVEMNNGRLIFYGLGNFLHQGMANMSHHGGCRDYGILARVHLVKQSFGKPELAAVEIVPVTNMHLRPKQIPASKAARRIAVLNGLARQFDNAGEGAKGVRFAVREDGTGLYCTAKARGNSVTANLCSGYRPYVEAHTGVYRSALNSCGRSFGPKVFASLKSSTSAQKLTSKKPVQVAVLAKPVEEEKPIEPVLKPKSETIETEQPKTIAKPAKSKSRKQKLGKLRPLSNKVLARMSKAERKRYWTRYWYLKRGRKVPKHLL